MAHIHYYFESKKSKYSALENNHLRLLYTGIVTDMKNWNSEKMQHTFFEMMYFYKGHGSVVMDGEEYPVRSGTLIIYKPGVVHMERTNDTFPFKFAFIAFDVSKRCEEAFGFLTTQRIIDTKAYSFQLEDTFTRLLNEASNHIDGYEMICGSMLQSMIILIARIEEANRIQNHAFSEAEVIRRFIDENYNKDLTLDSLSEIVYISKHHLSHMFKNEVGVAPISYLITKRMEHAKELLETTNLSVTQISARIGYENPNYFSQFFKRVVGESPLTYRARAKKEM